MLWPSAPHLAARLALRPGVDSERILEIGCGLALASLVGHRRGADMTASDCHPLTETFLLENLRLNDLRPMKYRRGQWGVAAGRLATDVQGCFDLIIGSDLLYERDADNTLVAFIARHAAPRAEVWIVDPDRGNRPAFNRAMAGQGFDHHAQRLSTSLPVGTGTLPGYKGWLLVYRRGVGMAAAAAIAPIMA